MKLCIFFFNESKTPSFIHALVSTVCYNKDYICFPKYGKLTKHYYNQTHSSEREYVEFDEGKTIKIFLCTPFEEVLPRSPNKIFLSTTTAVGVKS